MKAAGQSLNEYRHYTLHGVLLVMAVAAVVTAVAGRVTEFAPSPGLAVRPVPERTAGYLRPPVLLSTVPSVLSRQQTLSATAAPGATQAATPAPQDTPAPTPQPAPAYFTYTVQPGDSVAAIAQAFGISEDYIIWNNPHIAANPDYLVVGATVLVPSTNAIVYNVTVGDTLNDIASYYQVDVGSIIAYNQSVLPSADSVIEGMTLIIPGGVPPAPSPAAVTVIEDSLAPEPAAVEPEPTYVPPPAAPVSSGFIWPFYGNISTYFDWSHPGIDIDGFGAYGAPIVAAASGTVVLTAWDSWGYGYHVIIDHGDGTRTLYAHLSDIWVSQGEYVAQGQAIGALGSTGYSTGAHLMFNIYVGGVAVDPLAYLP